MVNFARGPLAGIGLFTLLLASAPAAHASNSCGLIGEMCCPSGDPCVSSAICNGNMCVACGGEDQFCCVGGCNEGLACITDLNESPSGQGGGAAIGPSICKPCGEVGQPCCDGGCDSGVLCQICTVDTIPGQGSGGTIAQCPPGFPSVCEPCGGAMEQCCEEEECDEGFDCRPVTGEMPGRGSGAQLPLDGCFPCGTLGEPCCDEETCLGENLLCGSEFCEACGDLGEQCCGDNTCPGSDAVCVEDICRALPPAPALNQSGLTVLILTLTTVGLLWMRKAQA